MCDILKLPGGATAIVCRGRSRTKPKKCGSCGNPATLLCDFAGVRRDDFGKTVEGTCDAPICARHATEIGPDRHLCWKHAQMREQGA